MDGAFDVPDSTDWLETSLKDFAALENALHCQICKEFYDTPMITSCNHTFCSRCIRTSLSADGKCPACRAADQASKLRNNWAIQEVTATFLTARPKALEVARKPQEEPEPPKRSGKRKRPTVLDEDDTAELGGLGRTTRSKSRRVAASQGSQPEMIEIEDSEGGEDQEYQPEPEPEQPKDGRVECPLGCGKRMKEGEVFDHLDKCEDEQKQATRAKSRTPLNGFVTPGPSSSQSHCARPQDRINELNYGMLKDAALSKKLKDQAIPHFGTKQLMTNRHKEWVNIWNANCDSNHPRSRRELLRDLDEWERTQGGKAPQGNGLTGSVMRKDYDGVAHAKRHQDDFSRLIADARRKKNIPATEISPPKDHTIKDTTPTNDGKSPVFSAAPPALTENDQSNKSTSQESRTTPVDPRPYEHDPEALAHVREKVAAVNEGRKIEPPMNEGFNIRQSSETSGDFPASRILTASASPGGQSRWPSQHNGDPPSLFRSSIDAPKSASSSSPSRPSTTLASPITLDTTMPDLTRPTSQDEHAAHQSTGSACDLPSHFYSSSPKKVPMFAVPEQPISDVDGGGGAAASHE